MSLIKKSEKKKADLSLINGIEKSKAKKAKESLSVGAPGYAEPSAAITAMPDTPPREVVSASESDIATPCPKSKKAKSKKIVSESDSEEDFDLRTGAPILSTSKAVEKVTELLRDPEVYRRVILQEINKFACAECLRLCQEEAGVEVDELEDGIANMDIAGDGEIDDDDL